ncbi:MAG: hypothetical protein ACYC7E_00520 [Armatimonadota bacterium]
MYRLSLARGTVRAVLIAIVLLIGVSLIAIIVPRLYHAASSPESWRQLQQWAATAKPGELLRGNLEFTKDSGRQWTPQHTQAEPIKFLFSDNPEYLYNTAIGKGLAYMRLTRDPAYRHEPAESMKFGLGMMHINMTKDASGQPLSQTLRVVARVERAVTDDGETFHAERAAVVRITKGACGLSTDVEAVAGRNCAVAWFDKPNVAPTSRRIAPGDAQVLFSQKLRPDEAISAMFDLEATNAFFVKIYVVFGDIADYQKIAFAPYGMTIGTNSGTGSYWKRIFRPASDVPPFDASNTRHGNITHLRYVKAPPAPDLQYLVDETWDQRPEGSGKELIKPKGGPRRPFKGDYNVEYTVVIPVRASSGKKSRFALVDKQRFGFFTGAAWTENSGLVLIPRGSGRLYRGAEGVLIDRVSVSSRDAVNYTFRWMLPGGSYGDQEFILVPLGER